jgi:hypothetical protein
MSASTIRNLLGLVQDRLRSFRGLGPQLTFTGIPATISARNAADNAFVIGRGADPLGNDDWVTLRHLNAVAGGAVREIRFSLVAAQWPGPVSSATGLPTGSFVISTQVNILVPFDDNPNTTLQVEGPGPVILLPSGSVNPFAPGLNSNLDMDLSIGAPGPVQAVLGGSPTVGQAAIIVRYVVPQS